MKKIVKSFILVAAAAMGFTSCQKELQEEVPVNKGTVQVTFVSGSPETKTSVDTSPEDKPVFSWDENETFAVLEQTDALAEATAVTYVKDDEGKANITATFTANAGKDSYNYVTVYPASGYVKAEELANATLSLPAVQTMAESSYDPAADLMVSEVVTTDSQPTEAQMVGFTRMAAVVKMTLKNLSLESGDEVEQVIFTAAGKSLAGKVSTDLSDPHKFTVAEGAGVDNITVNTTSSTDVYFTVLPTTLEAGDAYTVTILTNKKLYIKQGTIPEGNALDFQKGMVNRFGVNMDGVVASEKWVLVRDASTLDAGDIVTIAASDLNMVLSCYNATNYPYPSTNTKIVRMGDYLYHPIVTAASDNKKMVQPLVLSKRDANKVAFDFYNGVDYEGDTKSGYFTNTGTANQLKLQNYPNNNTYFYITISSESGVASIVASDSENNHKLLKYYDDYTDRFACVSEESLDETKHHDVCIYKLVDGEGVVPTAGAVVTVPDADEPLVVPVEGVAEETVFEGVKFTYVGDWNISVSDNAEWLTVNYADGALKYVAGANPGTARFANVTITATHEGEDAKTWSFKVVQKGAPVKVTVAEFIEKAVDPNVEYEVTGILTKKATSHSGSTTIADAAGKTATFKYIDMDMVDGPQFIDNETINLGDIVTIVAAVSEEKTGGSSTAHAICKGYYNFSASAEEDLVGYEGGSVKLTLKKGGDLEPAGDISCSVNGSGAEVAYTTNAMEATLTFEANDDAPRQAVVTFTDGYASASVAVVQGADTAKGNTWELVTDASTLEAGDQVIIAAKDYDVAMSTTISSERRSAVAVTKLGNYFLSPTADVQTLVLGKGSVDGTFAFYDGVNKGFLVSTSTSYKLNNQTYIDANTSFTVSIADGVATIGNKEGDYDENKIYYREGSSYNYFYSGTTAKQAICLYRLVGVKGEIPVVPADITVPTSEIAISEDATTSATAISEVEFDYVGDWTISVSSSEDWLKVDYADGVLTYTAEANNSTKRSATVTITATLGEQTLEPWTFNVLQKGVAQEISIAQFVTLAKDDNQPYKLTGKVVKLATNATTNGYFLEDDKGNQAQINYLDTEDGKNVWGHEDLELIIGDIVTVTTYAQGSKKGGSGSLASIYKGHYRLKATAEPEIAGYEGGSVTISVAVEQNGTLGTYHQPTAIEGSMPQSDFASFAYTTGSETATVTFGENSGSSRSVDVTFISGLAEVTVNIGQNNHPDVKVGWFLVTDVNELAAGDKVIIAAKTPDETLDFAIKTWTNTSTSTSMQIALMGNSIKDVTGLEQFTLAAGAEAYPDTFAFVRADGRYMSNSSGSLKTSTTLGEYTSWGVTIDSDSTNNGAAILKVSKPYNSKDTIMFTYTASNQTFSLCKPTDTGKGAIYLYKYYE